MIIYFTDLTDGELAAIIVVCIIVFFSGILFILPIGCLYCCFCWLPQKARSHQERVVTVLNSRRQSSDLPTFSLQSCQQPVLSDLDSPKYQEAVDKDASSSAPPVYED